jgi:hypothetical protein
LIKNWILSTTFILLCYTPWIILFLHESKYFSSQQWQIPVSEEITKSVGTLFSPINTMYDYDLTNLGALLFISVVLLIVLYVVFKILKDRNYSPSDFIGLGGFFVLIATMGFAILFSVLISPMIMARYSFPMVGCLWLSVAIILSRFYSKKIIFIPMLLIILLVGASNCVSFINYEHDINSSDLEFRYCINQISVNDTVLLLSAPFDGDFLKFYLNKTEIVVGYDIFLLYYDISNQSKKGKIWVFDNWGKNTAGTKDFKQLLTKKGFKLDDVSEINQIYGNYPRNIYLINSID